MSNANKKYLIIFFLLGSLCFGTYQEYLKELSTEALVDSLTLDVPGLLNDMQTTAFAQEENRGILIENSDLAIYAEKENEKVIEMSSNLSNKNCINLNKASLTELDTLPGIGPVKAQAIIDYRESHGDFRQKSDIIQVSGIGQATYEKIKGMITIE